MKEDRVFQGRLSDEELYLIENALNICEEEGYEGFENASELIRKLHRDFYDFHDQISKRKEGAKK